MLNFAMPLPMHIVFGWELCRSNSHNNLLCWYMLTNIISPKTAIYMVVAGLVGFVRNELGNLYVLQFDNDAFKIHCRIFS